MPFYIQKLSQPTCPCVNYLLVIISNYTIINLTGITTASYVTVTNMQKTNKFLQYFLGRRDTYIHCSWSTEKSDPDIQSGSHKCLTKRDVTSRETGFQLEYRDGQCWEGYF